MRQSPSSRRSGMLETAAPAVVAAVLTVVATRRGLAMTPDSWAYWEGSVSLLEGCGYRYVGGEPITSWPPLTSIYLAGAQAAFGVSIATVAGALSALSALAAAGWTRLAVALGLDVPLRPAVVLTTILLLVPWHQTLLSEPLMLAALPWLLVALVRCAGRHALEPREAWTIGAALVVQVLVRYVGLGLVAGAAMIIWRCGNRTRGTVLRAAGALGVPAVLWIACLLLLGERRAVDPGGFPLQLGARIIESASGLGTVFVTSRWGLNFVVLAGLLAMVAAVPSLPAVARAQGRGLAAFAGVLIATVAGMAALVPGIDVLTGRFLLASAVSLMFVAALVAGRAPSRAVRLAAWLLIASVLVVQAVRLTPRLAAGASEAWGPVLPPAARLGTRDAPGNVVPPPYPWAGRRNGPVSCR